MLYENSGLQIVSTIVYFVLIFISMIIAVIGSLTIIPYFTRKKIDEKLEIIKNRNVGVALVLGAFIWTIGRMCFETIKPIMNAWYSAYSSGFDLKTVLMWTGGIIVSLIIALLFSAATIYLSIKILMILTKDIDEWEEIKNGNVAVAIVISITIFVVGMFFESIISSIVVNLFNF